MDYKQYFISKWPEEAVGYIKDGEFYPLENIAADKQYEFEVDPAFLIEEPDALLHSHTTGITVQSHDPRSPSYQDLKYQIATDIEWGICVTDGQTCDDPLWWGNPNNRPPLLGREFIFNIQDCLCLCQDWFYQERGIVLPTEPRTPHWNEEGQNYMEDLYEQWGFERIELNTLTRGDVLFYKVRSPVVNHLGIYLGNNEVISHWYGRVSCIEGFGKWANYIQFAARLKQ
jgi:cell wall-associated NlpC family hydrolase